MQAKSNRSIKPVHCYVVLGLYDHNIRFNSSCPVSAELQYLQYSRGFDIVGSAVHIAILSCCGDRAFQLRNVYLPALQAF